MTRFLMIAAAFLALPAATPRLACGAPRPHRGKFDRSRDREAKLSRRLAFRAQGRNTLHMMPSLPEARLGLGLAVLISAVLIAAAFVA